MSDSHTTSIRQHSVPNATVPRVTFVSFIEALRGLMQAPQIPDVITAGKLTSDSTASKDLAYAAFRFFGLLEPSGQVKESFAKWLREPIGSWQWRETLRGIVREKYKFVFDALGEDLSGVRRRDLERAFELTAPSKTSLEQCITFFQRLCWASDIPIQLKDSEIRQQNEARKEGIDYPTILEDYMEPETRKQYTRPKALPPVEQPALRLLEDIPAPISEPVLIPAPAVEPSELPLQNEDLHDGDFEAQEPTPVVTPHSLLVNAVAEICPLLLDESNFELCVEILREVLPPKPDGTGPLPDLPPFDNTWSLKAKDEWLQIYRLKLMAEVKGRG